MKTFTFASSVLVVCLIVKGVIELSRSPPTFIGPFSEDETVYQPNPNPNNKNILEPFIPCEIPVTEDDAIEAFWCYISQGFVHRGCTHVNPPEGDYVKYFGPALDCVGDLYGGYKFGTNGDAIIAAQGCLGCLQDFTAITDLTCGAASAYICDEDNGFNLMTDICRDVCPKSCKSKIQTAALCSSRTEPNLCLTRGFLDFPPYACPN